MAISLRNKKGTRIILVTVFFFSTIGFLLVSFASYSADIAAGQASEYEIKAAYLYNFAKFIEWPSEALTPDDPVVVVGILGDDPFGRVIDDNISNKVINNHKIIIKRFKTPNDVERCHVLFISSSEEKRLPKIIDKIKKAAILTVGETESFISSGGIINFVIIDNKIRFEVNLEAGELAGLKISSKLLRLATTIKVSDKKKGP